MKSLIIIFFLLIFVLLLYLITTKRKKERKEKIIDAEFEELIQFVKDEFGVQDLTEDLEVIVEEAINAGVEIMKIIRMFKNS